MSIPIVRYFLPLFLIAGLILLVAAGWRGHRFEKPPFELLPDMDHQAKLKAQTESDFFADGLTSRHPVAGTVPMGFSIPAERGGAGADGLPVFGSGDGYYSTGRFGSVWGNGMPDEVDVDLAFLERGAQQYEIYCTVCHGSSGNGRGITSQYGLITTRNLHMEDQAKGDHAMYRPDGEVFNTISNGMGLMGGYGHNIALNDRWAIVAYLRVLQKQGLDTGVGPKLGADLSIPALKWPLEATGDDSTETEESAE